MHFAFHRYSFATPTILNQSIMFCIRTVRELYITLNQPKSKVMRFVLGIFNVKKIYENIKFQHPIHSCGILKN